MNGPIILPRLSENYEYILREYERVFAIPITNPRMDDDRRTIHEDDDKVAQSSTQAFLVKNNDRPLGNHYHIRRTELFFIVEGEVELLVTSNPAGKFRKVSTALPTGTLIVIPPLVAHAFRNSNGGKMLCVSTERYADEDMIPLILIP